MIDENDTKKALRAAHGAFFLSNKIINIGLIGPGIVGSVLLDQIKNELEKIKNDLNIDLQIRGVINSKKMILSEMPIDLSNWREIWDKELNPANINKFVKQLNDQSLPHTVLIDTTASEMVSKKYQEWSSKGIHIITPNKKASTLPYQDFIKFKKALRQNKTQYFYETTVGAGLPIIETLQGLIHTGDEIVSIEGVLSGTMGVICHRYDGSSSFSNLIKELKETGYTEPDPRDDLSGMDVARKVVILAREMGLKTNTSDVNILGMIPKDLEGVPLENFMNELSNYDQFYHDLFNTYKKPNELLKYVGVINPKGKFEAKLQSYDKNHPFSRIAGSDNIVAFKTKRYFENPLIVQGPGAGPEVTAAGVFGDLLKLSRYQ